MSDIEIAQKFVNAAQLCADMHCDLADVDNFIFADRVRAVWREAESVMKQFDIKVQFSKEE